MVHDKELVCTCHYFEHQQLFWCPGPRGEFSLKIVTRMDIGFYINLFARVTTVHLWARVTAQWRRWTASGGWCTTPGSMVSQEANYDYGYCIGYIRKNKLIPGTAHADG